MLSGLYSKWMFAWETKLTTADTNRIVRPLEWGFNWLADFSPIAAKHANQSASEEENLTAMVAVNEEIVRRSDEFFGYVTPADFRLEQRYPELFPTNVRPETLAQDAFMQAE